MTRCVRSHYLLGGAVAVVDVLFISNRLLCVQYVVLLSTNTYAFLLSHTCTWCEAAYYVTL